MVREVTHTSEREPAQWLLIASPLPVRHAGFQVAVMVRWASQPLERADIAGAPAQSR